MKLERLQYFPASPTGGSPLLFVHGVCHAAWCWAHWAHWFSRRGREVSALSLRGHGASEGRASLDKFGLEDYRDDVLDAARAMDGPILVAHSMGGAVAQLALSAEPSLFKAVVLLASPPPDGLRIGEVLPLLLQVRGMLCLRKLLGGQKLTAREVRALPFFDGRIPPEEAAQVSDRLQPESKKAGREAGAFRAPAFEARLPVLVIGSRRDRLLPLSALQRTAAYYSGDLIVLEEPCHDIMLDPAWEDGAAKLEDWLLAQGL